MAMIANEGCIYNVNGNECAKKYKRCGGCLCKKFMPTEAEKERFFAWIGRLDEEDRKTQETMERNKVYFS